MMKKHIFLTPRKRMLTVLCVSFSALGSARMPVDGAPGTLALQDLRAIEHAVRTELARQAPGSVAEIAPIDPRLRLAACDKPLRAALPPNVAPSPRMNIRVSCGGGGTEWSMNVPVTLSTEASVVIAQRALPLGSTIAASDVAVVTRRIPGTARCCASDPGELIGRVIRRTVSADQVIPLDAVEHPPLIRRGETVAVIASMPGIEIRSSGIALGDARSGESVRVRHTTSLKVIQARADTQGVVRVDR